jgi:uncharacterized membrane protein YkvA (DUF1232 family)
MRTLLARWNRLKTDTFALFFVLKNPEAPLRAKFITLLTIAYLFIPLDLAPDFIPFFGLIDDLILIPLGFTLAARFTPPLMLDQAKLDANAWWFRTRHKFLLVIAGVVFLFILLTYFIWIALQSP